ncbi:MAG: hypothetical protein AB1847_08800 [bacterium]
MAGGQGASVVRAKGQELEAREQAAVMAGGQGSGRRSGQQSAFRAGGQKPEVRAAGRSQESAVRNQGQ